MFFNKKNLLVLFIFFTSFYTLYCENKNEVDCFIRQYIDKQINIDFIDYYSLSYFFHPDFFFLPGEYQKIHIVGSSYTISSMERKKMDFEYMDLYDIETIEVKVSFNLFCDIDNVQLIETDEKAFERTYYLIQQNSIYKIIDFTDLLWKTSSINSVNKWIKENRNMSPKMNELSKKLEELIIREMK